MFDTSIKVKVKQISPIYPGFEGVIVEQKSLSNKVKVHLVQLDCTNDPPAWFIESELEKVN